MTSAHKVTALIIDPGLGESGLIRVNNTELVSYCPLIGGWTRQETGKTRCGQQFILFYDEDGLLNGHPLNDQATKLWHILGQGHRGQQLYGVVIATGGPSMQDNDTVYADVPVPLVHTFRDEIVG